MCAPRSTRSCLTASSSPRTAAAAAVLAADSVVIAGTLQPNTELYEMLVAALPNTAVHAAGDCTGLGLIRKATEDGARAACAI